MDRMTGFVQQRTAPLRMRGRETEGALEKCMSCITKKKGKRKEEGGCSN